ncbi:hypothetical protein GGI43DRAFT_394265 [Trichoderma evansii]
MLSLDEEPPFHANLDLATQAPSATNQLSAICARVGLQAKCCTVGIVSFSLLESDL